MNFKATLKNKIAPFFKENYGWFIIPIFVIVVFCLAQASFGIYPFGKAIMASYDMLAQECPMLEHFFSVIDGESGLFHTFFIGGGMDMFGSLAYCVVSPFTFLFILGGKGNTFYMVSIVLPLKVACSGLTAYCFLRKCFKDIPTYLSVTLALLYAYGGYLYVANTYIVWLDISIYMPLVLLGFQKLINNDSVKLFAVSLSCMIYACFSIACFSFFLLFPILIAYMITCVDKTQRKHKITRMCFGFVLAVAMALPILLPSLASYLKSGRNTGLFSEIFKIYSQTDINKGKLVVHLYEKFTYIFCNSAFIFLGAYYFVCAPKEDKFAKYSFIAFAILILPCLVDESMLLLNMGSYMSYALRFGFLIDSLGLVVAAKGLRLMLKNAAVVEVGGENCSKKNLKPILGFVIVCAAVCVGVLFTFRFFNYIYDGEYNGSSIISAFMKWASMDADDMPFKNFFACFAHSEGGLETTFILLIVVILVFVVSLLAIKCLKTRFKDVVIILCVLALSQPVFFNFSLVKGDRQGGSKENYDAYEQLVDGVNDVYGENYYRYKNYKYYISSDSPLVLNCYAHSLFSSMADAKNITAPSVFGYANNGQNSTKTNSGSTFSDAVLSYKYIVYNMYDGDNSSANSKDYYSETDIYGYEKPAVEIWQKIDGKSICLKDSEYYSEEFGKVTPNNDIKLGLRRTGDLIEFFINGKSVYTVYNQSPTKSVKTVGNKCYAEVKSFSVDGDSAINSLKVDKWQKNGSYYKISGSEYAYLTYSRADFENIETVYSFSRSTSSSAFVSLRICLENGNEYSVQINTPKYSLYENELAFPSCAVVDGDNIKFEDGMSSDEKLVAVYDFLNGGYSGKSKIYTSDIRNLKNKLEKQKIDYQLAPNEIVLPKITAEQGQKLYLNYVNLDDYEVVVNGKKREFIENDLDFMIIELDNGENEVTIKYKPSAYKYIVCGVLLGGLIVALYVVLKKKAYKILQKSETLITAAAYVLSGFLVIFFLIFPTGVFLYKLVFKYIKMF